VAENQRRSLIQDFNLDAPYVTESRRLLQSLARRDTAEGSRVYLLTSAGRGEGKSTITSMLGVVAARVFHKRTLVLDGDMRRPTVHTLMSMRQTPGLREVLRGDVLAERAVRQVPLLPTLSVMTSGVARHSAHEMYDNDRFRDVLEILKPAFDLILIDAAPVVPVVEPLLMAEHADSVLLVVMAGRTPVNLLRRMREIIEPVAPKVSGIILNNATEGLPYYYDYKYYGYAAETPKRKGGGSPPDGLSAALLRFGSTPGTGAR